jgi:YVTN family beta-propeller protein
MVLLSANNAEKAYRPVARPMRRRSSRPVTCLQISPDVKRAYIANYSDHTVSVVGTITESVSTVAVSDHPELLALSPMARGCMSATFGRLP